MGAGEAVNEMQKKWVEVQNIALNLSPAKKSKPPTTKLRLKFWDAVTHPVFDIVVISMIILNTVFIAMTYSRMSKGYEIMITTFNYIFVVFYNIEMALKLGAMGLQYFTHDSWNIFDFICVIASDISLILVIASIEGPLYSIVIFLRAFRMLRLLKYLNNYGGAETLKTLLDATPQIRNILTLIILITFIYAILGLNLFGTVMYREYYNSKNNFRNIFDAFLLLIRCLTGEDWNKIMHDLADKSDFEGQSCLSSQTYEDMQRDGVLG